MYGPMCLCPKSHAWRCGDPFEYMAAASSNRGVVGSSGTNMPIMPSANAMLPNIIKRIFMGAKIVLFF